MSTAPKILWLEGIFDEETIKTFPASSPAVNFLLSGFVSALSAKGCKVTIIGHPYDRIWPFGRAFVTSTVAKLAPGLLGQVTGYVNLPVLREKSQTINYMRKVKKYVAEQGRPDYVFTFNDSPGIPAAKYLSKDLGVPWVYIAGDGVAIQGADAYVIQNWAYFESFEATGPKIHFDGGLPSISKTQTIDPSSTRSVKAIMYMGALTEHGGAVQLARAFHSLDDVSIELWITGRGSNLEIEKLAQVDHRIKLYGFVDQEQLSQLASKARMFANPRPSDFAPNKLNYPSKLLHYLAYGKPVLSTFTDGLSPEYQDVLIPIDEEGEAGFARAIHNALLMPDKEYEDWRSRVAKFNMTHDWNHQISRLLLWLDCEFKGIRLNAEN